MTMGSRPRTGNDEQWHQPMLNHSFKACKALERLIQAIPTFVPIPQTSARDSGTRGGLLSGGGMRVRHGGGKGQTRDAHHENGGEATWICL